MAFVGPSTEHDRVHRIIPVDPHVDEASLGSFRGTSEPGYLGDSPYPSSVMYMFRVILRAKFDPVGAGGLYLDKSDLPLSVFCESGSRRRSPWAKSLMVARNFQGQGILSYSRLAYEGNEKVTRASSRVEL